VNNSYLPSLRGFSDYLFHEAGVAVGDPVTRSQAWRLPQQTGFPILRVWGLKISEKSLYNPKNCGIMPTL
jgi:hypothetical protein